MDTNPLNISIAFNINSQHQQRPNSQQHLNSQHLPAQMQDGRLPKRCQEDIRNKTPERLLLTDRRSRDNECIKPTQHRTLHERRPTHEHKNKKKNRKYETKIEPIKSVYNEMKAKEKRNKPYRRGQTINFPLKKTTHCSESAQQIKNKSISKSIELKCHAHQPSTVIQSKTDRKSKMERELKTIINRMINNELTKRELLTRIKGKKNKKMERSTKPNKFIWKDDPCNLIAKVSSLKSVGNIFLKSEEQQESTEHRTIVIKTDESLDFLHDMQDTERQFRGVQKDQAEAQQGGIQLTKQLISTYIALLQGKQPQNVMVDACHSQLEMQESQIGHNDQHPIQLDMTTVSQQQVKTSGEMFVLEELISQGGRRQFKNVEQAQEIQSEGDEQANDKQHGIRIQVCASCQESAEELENLKELKKQEIEKWGTLLQFIKAKMNDSSVQTQDLISMVYGFLQKTKEDLQADLRISQQHNSRNTLHDLESFTLKLSTQLEKSPEAECLARQQYPYHLGELTEKNQQHKLQQQEHIEDRSSNSVVNQSESGDQMSSEVKSYKQAYMESGDDQFKLLNLQAIERALSSRQSALQLKLTQDISALEERYENDELSFEEMHRQRQALSQKIKEELSSIITAKKNIYKGYNEAKSIIEKSTNSRHLEENGDNIRRSMSENYLGRKNLSQNYQPQGQRRSQAKDKIRMSATKHCDAEDNGSEEELAIIRERLASIKLQNLKKKESAQNSPSSSQGSGGQDVHNLERFSNLRKFSDISYQEIEKELEEEYSNSQSSEYNSLQMKIINQEIREKQKTPDKKIQQQGNQMHKLQTLSGEDKEDIFQFIFLDLCIELYQQPCHDNRIMRNINLYVQKIQRNKNIRKGVKTNLMVVKEYLKRFSKFLLRTNRTCLNSFNVPMGPTAKEVLQYMHDNDDDNEETNTALIIPLHVFDSFEKTLLPSMQFEEYYSDEEKESQRVEFLKNVLHIHNKALFDALNEYLDQLRSFGIWGKPFPWKKSSNFQHVFLGDALEEKLKKGIEKVAEYCSFVCGLLPDKQDSLINTSRISENQLEQIKQDRLSRMLANDVYFYRNSQLKIRNVCCSMMMSKLKQWLKLAHQFGMLYLFRLLLKYPLFLQQLFNDLF